MFSVTIEHFFRDALASALLHHSRPGSCLHWGCPDAPTRYSALAVGGGGNTAMDFGEMQTPFQKLGKMERGGDHRLSKGETSRMRLSPLWKWNSERKRPSAKIRLVFVLRGYLCSASLQVILWLKMEFVLAPNLNFFCIAFGASALMYLSWIQETCRY